MHFLLASPFNLQRVAMVALFLAIATPAIAQQPERASVSAKLTDLDVIVVTATKHPQSSRTAPASISVIDRQHIQQRPSADLLDVVRDVPGITLAPRQVGGRKTFSIRGLEGKHTLMLIDGRRISASDDVAGHSDYQYGWVPLSAVEQVEVVRGPLSALYGSEALGGVVNTITRWSEDVWQGQFNVAGERTLADQAASGDKAAGYLAGPLGERAALRLNATRHHVGAIADAADPRYSEIEGRSGASGGAAMRIFTGEYQRLELGWQGGDEKRFYDDVSRTGIAHQTRYLLDRSHAWAQWNGDFPPASVQLRTYRSALEIVNSRTNGVAPARPQAMADAVADGHARWKWHRHQFTLGGEWRRETLENAGLRHGQDSANHKALYVQDEISLTDALAATLGLRADHHQLFGQRISPRAYVVFTLNDAWVIKGGYGSSFKAPTLKQISPNYESAEGPHTFYGNPGVRPETARTFELGVDWARDRITVRGALFRSDIDDLITVRLLRHEGPRMFYRYDNVNQARVAGAEAGFTWELADAWRWNNDLTLLQTRDADTHLPLEDRPRRSWNSQLQWKGEHGLHARLALNHTGTQTTSGQIRLPAYSVVHFGFGQALNLHLSWHVGLDNLTDVRLAEKSPHFGYAIRGRTVDAGIELRF